MDYNREVIKGEKVLLSRKPDLENPFALISGDHLFPGTTVIFSPLIALMRDQVKKLSITRYTWAKCINSEQTPEENTQIINEARTGEYKKDRR